MFRIFHIPAKRLRGALAQERIPVAREDTGRAARILRALFNVNRTFPIGITRVHLAVFALLMIAGPTVGLAQSYRSLAKVALKQYEKGEFEQALSTLGETLSAATNTQADVSIPYYNLGNTLYRMGDLEKAAEAYARAMEGQELDPQADAYYNRGNARYRTAEGLYEGKKLNEAVQQMKESMEMFESALRLNPTDREAKNNFELAYNKHAVWSEELEQQQQEQQQDQKQQDDQQQDQEKDQEKDDAKGDSEKEPPQDSPQDDPSQNQQDQPQDSPKSPPDQEQPSDPSDGDPNQDPGEREEQQPQPAEAEAMTEAEAKMMLDAMRQEEQSDRNKARVILGKPVSVDKDW